MLKDRNIPHCYPERGEHTLLFLNGSRKNNIPRLALLVLPLLLGISLVVLLFSLSAVQARGALGPPQGFITVETLEDEEIVNGSCSLREAITAANINYAVDKCPAGGVFTDTIVFAVAGTITLSSQLPYILVAGPLVIDGAGEIVVSGNDEYRVFWVNPNARLALHNLKIISSHWPSYSTTGGGGFALYNNGGEVSIQRCEFSDNVSYAELGGAIYNKGTMIIGQSKFEQNSVHFNDGGAIANESNLTIMDSTFTNNYSAGDGGAIANLSNLTMMDSTFTNNMSAGNGGAIWNDGVFNIDGSIFFQNESLESGGGIVNSGSMSVTNSSISNNTATGHTSNCEFGGEALNNIGWAKINYSTLTDKSAEGNTLICNRDDGTLIIQNSIIASDSPYTNCLGTITDGGYNIDSLDSCGFNTSNGSLVNTDPMLGLLQYNGGPTWTFAPQMGSPAMDAANPLICPSTDQRGVPRPFDGDGDGEARCDIGAYEVVPSGIPRPTQTSITSVSPTPSLVNKPVFIGFQVTSAFGVPSGTVTVTVADHAESCVGSLNNGSGSCSFMLADPGIYTLTATYGGEGDYLTSADIQAHQILTTIAFLPLVPKEHPLAVQVIGVGVNSGDRGLSYYMQGMLKNISNKSVYSISVTAYIFDEEGFLEGVYSKNTPLPAIFPGQNMPFNMGTVSYYQPPDSYKIIPSYSYHSSRKYRPVTVVYPENGTCHECDWSIPGVIRNDQVSELRSIKVIVSPGGYESSYTVATLGADALLPGETTTYTFGLACGYCWPVPCPCPTDFSIQGQGYLFP